jgi:tetratricopeptide (TPR) repeat protein
VRDLNRSEMQNLRIPSPLPFVLCPVAACVWLLVIPRASPRLSAQGSTSIATAAGYWGIVESYRRQDPAALARLNAVDRGDIARSVARAAAADLPGGTVPDAEVLAAVMLHTDAGLDAALRHQSVDLAFHLDQATTLLDAALRSSAPRTGFARRWFSVVQGMLHAFGATEESDALRSRAATRLPFTDAERRARQAFERGLDMELHGALEGPLSRSDPRLRQGTLDPAAQRWFSSARSEYEQALSADAQCAEAALHLGRIHILAGRPDLAGEPLTRAADAGDVPVRYLALLFLGSIAEEMTRFDEAERRYRAAMDTFRWGQAAELALAHVLDRSGRRGDARDVIATHFGQTHASVVDPLWIYLSTPDESLKANLDELRAEVWR